MNRRTEILSSTFKPTMALFVYQSPSAPGRQANYYLESHSINDEGQIMEGKPLLQESIAVMVDFFYQSHKERSRISGFIPSNVLFYAPSTGGGYKLVWHKPAEIRQAYFSTPLKIPSGKVWAPAMVYHAEDNELSVYALKSDKRPEEKNRLYRGPFHNVDDDGKVCLGTAKIKKPAENTFANIMQYWEELFWRSEFSHVNGDDKPTKSDVTAVWRRLMKSKCRLKWEALDELKQTKQSLKNILQ